MSEAGKATLNFFLEELRIAIVRSGFYEPIGFKRGRLPAKNSKIEELEIVVLDALRENGREAEAEAIEGGRYWIDAYLEVVDHRHLTVNQLARRVAKLHRSSYGNGGVLEDHPPYSAGDHWELVQDLTKALRSVGRHPEADLLEDRACVDFLQNEQDEWFVAQVEIQVGLLPPNPMSTLGFDRCDP